MFTLLKKRNSNSDSYLNYFKLKKLLVSVWSYSSLNFQLQSVFSSLAKTMSETLYHSSGSLKIAQK